MSLTIDRWTTKIPYGGVIRESWDLVDPDGSVWSGDSPAAASFELRLSDSRGGATLYNADDDVTGYATSGSTTARIQVEVSGSDVAANFSAGDTAHGVLFWTPAGGEKEAVAILEVYLSPVST